MVYRKLLKRAAPSVSCHPWLSAARRLKAPESGTLTGATKNHNTTQRESHTITGPLDRFENWQDAERFMTEWRKHRLMTISNFHVCAVAQVPPDSRLLCWCSWSNIGAVKLESESNFPWLVTNPEFWVRRSTESSEINTKTTKRLARRAPVISFIKHSLSPC
jgi:hypothetical protein